MNWLDIVLLIFLIISVLMGIRAGLIKVLFTLIGGIVGVVLAGRFSGSLGSKMTFIPGGEGNAKIAAFVIILVVVLIIAMILAWILKKVVSAVMLGWVNMLGGGILGLVLGVITAGALITMYVKFAGGSSVITDSKIATFLVAKFPVVLGLLPSDFKSVKDFFQ